MRRMPRMATTHSGSTWKPEGAIPRPARLVCWWPSAAPDMWGQKRQVETAPAAPYFRPLLDERSTGQIAQP